MAKDKFDLDEFEKRDAWAEYRKFYSLRMKASLVMLAVIALLLLAVYFLK